MRQLFSCFLHFDIRSAPVAGSKPRLCDCASISAELSCKCRGLNAISLRRVFEDAVRSQTSGRESAQRSRRINDVSTPQSASAQLPVSASPSRSFPPPHLPHPVPSAKARPQLMPSTASQAPSPAMVAGLSVASGAAIQPATKPAAQPAPSASIVPPVVSQAPSSARPVQKAAAVASVYSTISDFDVALPSSALDRKSVV